MEDIILTLHPTTDAAWFVVRDPRNVNQLAHENTTFQGETSALSLSLSCAPKKGSNYVIGRFCDADIVLSDPTSSSRHCTISTTVRGVPWLHENSKNGTLINGKPYNNQALEIENGMQITIGAATFDVRIPWRGMLQEDYEFMAKRAKDSRAETPLQPLSIRSEPSQTAWIETLGPYTLTNACIKSEKLAGREVSRVEIVRKGGSFFAAKRFNRKGCGQRELQAWKKINESGIQHPHIIHLEEILQEKCGPVIVMELLSKGQFDKVFCENGDLVPHDIAINVMRQLSDALDFLHTLGITHTAVRLDNLLVFSEQPLCVKLTGFEFSSFDDSSCTPTHAPEAWERRYRNGVAPQIWENILADRGYPGKRLKTPCGSPLDIWSAGVVCSLLTLGKAPCYLDSNKSRDEQAADYVDFLLAARLENSTERAEAWAQRLGFVLTSIPLLLLNFLQKLLDPEPASRAKAKDCLVDPWLMQNAQHSTDNGKEPHLEEPARKRRRLNSTS